MNLDIFKNKYRKIRYEMLYDQKVSSIMTHNKEEELLLDYLNSKYNVYCESLRLSNDNTFNVLKSDTLDLPLHEISLLYDAAILYFRKNDFNKAINCFKRIIISDTNLFNNPNNYFFYYYLGRCFFAKGDYDLALNYFNIAKVLGRHFGITNDLLVYIRLSKDLTQGDVLKRK